MLKYRWSGVAELAAVAGWSLWVGRAYLDFSSDVWPVGSDFSLTLHGHVVWEWLSRCGTCIMWNGALDGGNPAFVDLLGAPLHPFVIVATVALGVVNAGKAIALASLFGAGAAQWWLARVLGLGLAPRLWSAFLVVVAGHLAGRMELGMVGIMFSTASVCFVLPPLIALCREPRRRTAIVLAATAALAVLSGGVYLQLGLVLAIFPAAAFLFVGRDNQRDVWRELAVAAALALLLCAVLWVPTAHFWPNLAKEVMGPGSVRLPYYTPLSLVVSDLGFYVAYPESMTGQAAFFYYYLGWVPVLLAFASFCFAGRRDARLLAFLASAILLVFLAGSAVTQRWLAPIAPPLVWMRFPSLILALAVPLVVTLAAVSVERMLRLNWPGRYARAWRLASCLVTGGVVSGLMTWSVANAYETNHWLRVARIDPSITTRASALVGPEARWMRASTNDYELHLLLSAMGTKLTVAHRPWGWRTRSPPAAEIDTHLPPGTSDLAPPEVLDPGSPYAYVELPDGGVVRCRATALGGSIDVECSAPASGRLVVRENPWTGWRAWRDGVAVERADAMWLEVEAPAGTHRFAFRYLPWDVALGLFLSLSGACLSGFLWRKARNR